MAVSRYRTVLGSAEVEIEVDRSRFLAHVARTAGEPEARALVEAARKEHWSARHHVSAFVIGPDRSIERSNDDGEPPGTGGAPILDVLRGRELSDVAVVVTRWFGGVLLGTGGLARAYADSVRAALDEIKQVERVLLDTCAVTVDHSAVGRLEHALRARGATILGVEYADQAELRIAVPPLARTANEETIAELTGGQSTLRALGQEWADEPAN